MPQYVTKPGTNYVFDPTTGDIVGVMSPDGGVELFGGNNNQTAYLKTELTANINAADNTIYSNNSANNHTVTIGVDTVTKGVIVQQNSTGTVTVAAGAGVTFIPSGSQVTVDAGDLISVIPTSTANTFQVVQGGVLTKADVGLDEVDNTSDADKPISAAVAAVLSTKSEKFNAPLTAVAGRVLADSDHDKTIVPTNNAQTYTINTGLTAGFSCFIGDNATIAAGSGVTVTDKRVAGATNPTFAIINTGAEAYVLIGGKA